MRQGLTGLSFLKFLEFLLHLLPPLTAYLLLTGLSFLLPVFFQELGQVSLFFSHGHVSTSLNPGAAEPSSPDGRLAQGAWQRRRCGLVHPRPSMRLEYLHTCTMVSANKQ